MNCRLTQYYGGTNYERTAAAFSTTRYYDEAPLDEYGKITLINPLLELNNTTNY